MCLTNVMNISNVRNSVFDRIVIISHLKMNICSIFVYFLYTKPITSKHGLIETFYDDDDNDDDVLYDTPLCKRMDVYEGGFATTYHLVRKSQR